MSDPRVPPPRRPAPDQLRERVLAQLQQAPRHRVRPRYVVLPVAAAAAATALVLGVATLGDQSTTEPAMTASPAPPTVSASAPTTSPTPTPRPSVELNVRPMTKAEIAADSTSCRTPDKNDTDPLPQRGKLRPVYAMVQRAAGLDGPSAKTTRLLLTQDDLGVWVCEDGSNTAWSADELAVPRPTAAVPAAEADSYGGSASSCGDAGAESTGMALYSAGQQVAVGRVRVVKGKVKGPWLTSTPANGLVHFIYHVRGEDALAKGVSAEFQFLGDDGKPVTLQPYGPRGTKTATADSAELHTCGDLPKRLTPKALQRPKSDRAGVASCQKLIKDAASLEGTVSGADWTSQLIVSTAEEWGAVLTNGSQRIGCSLFPTQELSPVTSDTTKINKAAFRFALNPIALPEGESLWAAGRVPPDVTKINYRLPGERDVAAKINSDGYWMLKFHLDGSLGGSDDTSDWDPVVVTVTGAAGTQTFTLPFTEKTMCHQISHGC